MIAALLISATLGTDGYALVVTNNRSLDLARPDLRYADDDGAQWAQLFSEILGPERVELLTRFDSESRRLYAEERTAPRPPTRENLERALQRLEDRLTTDTVAKDVYLVFAGHGDIADGVGFLELEDSRFDAYALEAILTRLQGHRVHVVLDSCNSYFMLNPRSASVKRWEPPETGHQSVLERFPNVGAVISTSAEALTYEWSELQSGVFSYELRSGLRGAADADGDGTISYIELEAFVSVAHAPVENELYRPKVFARAPEQDSASTFLDTRASSSLVLRLTNPEELRLTFRDQFGIRILDVNKEAGTELTLRLPRGRRIEIAETRLENTRPALRVRALPEQSPSVYSELTSHTAATSGRGTSRLFRSLFSLPFGRRALDDFRRRAVESDELPFAISLRETERLQLHLEELEDRYDGLFWEGMVPTLIFSGIALVIPAAALDQDVATRDELRSAAVVSSVFLGMTGVFSLLFALPDDSDRLLKTYRDADFSTVEARTENVLAIEREFFKLTESEKLSRQIGGGFAIAAGAPLLVSGAVDLVNSARAEPGDERRFRTAIGAGVLVLGTLVTSAGVWHAFYGKSDAERAWERYLQGQGPRETPRLNSVSVAPWLAPNAGGVSFGMRF